MKMMGDIIATSDRLYDAECTQCGASFMTAAFFREPQPGEKLKSVCEACSGRREREREEEERTRKLNILEQHWREDWHTVDGDPRKAICPRRYQNFDEKRFTGNRQKLEEAMAWEFGPKGLVLHGHTGQGKTWAAFMVAKREHFENRRGVMSLNGNRLREVVSIVSESNTRYNQELGLLIRCQLLVINDPFKVKLTDKVEEALWEIIDERYEWERPIVLTMNGVAANIEPLLSPDRGKALFRRLREENHTIHFPAPKDQ